jgi:DnaJ like chaperone protein
MKADKKLLKSELDFVKDFLVRTFGQDHGRDLMILFKDILEQEYPLRDVCAQIKRHMDHPARLEMVHLLFGLAQADGHIAESEAEVIKTISGYLGISATDFDSIQAMFVKDTGAAYLILEVDEGAGKDDVKKAFRKMANKYHPDKVAHLGEDFGAIAEEKFKAINDAYQQIKDERGWG